MADLTGKLVAVSIDRELLFGLVARHDKNSLHLADARGRQRKVNQRFLIAALGSSAPDRLAADIDALSARIGAARKEIDTEFLWECVRDAGDAPALADLCETYFGEADPAHQVALYLAVCDDPVRFKVKGADIQARPADIVAAQQAALERQREREAWEQQALAFIAAILDGREAPPPPEDLLDRLEALLYRHQHPELAALIESLPDQPPPRETAFDVLDACDRLPADADPALLIAGIRPDFAPDLIAAANALSLPDDLQDRPDFTPLVPFSIDDPDTREVDDAITVELLPDGLRVGIHIADVAAFVAKDDPLDFEAMRRVSTLYLPQRSVTMLPERLGCDLASLNEATERPTATCLVELDADGAVRRCEHQRGRLAVTHRLDYDQADAIIRGDAAHPLTHALQRLDTCTAALLAERRRHGALVIPRPELKVRMVDGEVTIKRIPEDSPSRRLVSELMILVNRLTAEYAAEQRLGVIYRAQDAPRQALEVPDSYDPVRLDALFRQLRPSRLSTIPHPHAALGLPMYVQASSPLRRFTDLVIQRQITAHLAGEEPPYAAEHLMGVIGSCLGVEQEFRALERRSTRFCILTWLADQPPTDRYPATVVNSHGGPRAELDDFLQRGTLANAGNTSPGDRIEVTVDRVEPRQGRLILRRCG